MRLLVYGDSNTWGFPPDGSLQRMAPEARWPGILAARLGADVIEEALPGRTTVHDDAQLLGHAMNGLAYLPVALRSHHPLDLALIMLGTNDFKARFSPDASTIAGNIMRLVDTVNEVGGGNGPWGESPAPPVAVIAPPPLPMQVENPSWERCAEWAGGRAASLQLAEMLTRLGAERGVPVFNAGSVVAGSKADPIHLDAEAHQSLGAAVSDWLQMLGLA